MNNYYLENWQRLRHVEGAAQRVQEDTMRFAGIMENLGVQIVDAVMTLFAFLPVLMALSDYVTELPIIGVSRSAVLCGDFLVHFRHCLPCPDRDQTAGAEFRNQRVEAAFRKELVYGEDYAERAEP